MLLLTPSTRIPSLSVCVYVKEEEEEEMATSSSASGVGGMASERRGIPIATFVEDVQIYLSRH